MNHLLATRALTGLAFFTCTTAAFAHEGHGAEGLHWHASDVSGFLLVVVLATFAILLSRGE